MAHFMRCAALKLSLLAIQAQVVDLQRILVGQGTRCVPAPKTNGAIRRVITEAGVVEVRAHGEAVNLPRTDTGLYLEPVKAQAHVGALANIDQSPRAILHLLSPESELKPVPFIPRSDFEECCLTI